MSRKEGEELAQLITTGLFQRQGVTDAELLSTLLGYSGTFQKASSIQCLGSCLSCGAPELLLATAWPVPWLSLVLAQTLGLRPVLSLSCTPPHSPTHLPLAALPVSE